MSFGVEQFHIAAAERVRLEPVLEHRQQVLQQSYDGCAMTVVFSCLWNCSGCKDYDFRDEGREFQHVQKLQKYKNQM